MLNKPSGSFYLVRSKWPFSHAETPHKKYRRAVWCRVQQKTIWCRAQHKTVVRWQKNVHIIPKHYHKLQGSGARANHTKNTRTPKQNTI